MGRAVRVRRPRPRTRRPCSASDSRMARRCWPDLSHAMGMLGNFEHPDSVAAIHRTAAAASSHGKQCGILLPTPKDFKEYYEFGYRFIVSGSDAALLNNAARSLVEAVRSVTL